MSRRQFEAEMARHIEEHISFPSIVMYVIFNEGALLLPTETNRSASLQHVPGC